MDVARFVRLVSFRPGAIVFEPAPGTPANLAHRLSARLKDWTGQPWLVAAEGGGGAESQWEKQKREAGEARKDAESDPFVQAMMQAFPGTELLDVRVMRAEPAPASHDDNEDDDED
jgi:DNA polymerase III subunit gamma/tau